MDLRGVIAQVLAIILSVQLTVGPVFAGARGIDFSDQGSVAKSREGLADFYFCNQYVVSGKATVAFTTATSFLAESINLKGTGDVSGAGEATQNAQNTIGSINLLGGEWSEALKHGLFGGINLSVAHVLEGALNICSLAKSISRLRLKHG